MKTIVTCILVLAAGCQTQFTGSPHIDPATCQAKCAEQRLVMAGMVYMGEYSSACICEIPRPPGAPAPVAGAATGAAAGAAAGVVMQMRRAEEQRRQQAY